MKRHDVRPARSKSVVPSGNRAALQASVAAAVPEVLRVYTVNSPSFGGLACLSRGVKWQITR